MSATDWLILALVIVSGFGLSEILLRLWFNG